MKSVECKNCGKPVLKSIQRYNESLKNGWNFFCSRVCRYGYQENGIKFPCAQCGKIVRKTPNQIRRTKANVFCSKSCAALFNNSHKTRGTRRSLLERFLEQQLKEEFATLDLRCNTTDPIGIELDFYFPALHLAIELNGVVHYKPIYGYEKFERIQSNDRVKAARCLEKEIELKVINVSGVKIFSEKEGEKYWNIVKVLVTSVIQKRAGYTNVQVL
jgi:hypothetical protein